MSELESQPALPVMPVMPVMPDSRRVIDVLVLSDIHLGTRHCQAQALVDYLEAVAPRCVVLNGDILDLREMSTTYWPETHARILSRLLGLAQSGIPVHYVIGNHDEALRRIVPMAIGRLQLHQEVVLQLAGEPVLFVHGDTIEHGIQLPRILRRLGCRLYYSARYLDRISRACGWRSLNLVGRLQRSPQVAAHIERFEQACAAHAAARGLRTIVTGHIHAPRSRAITLGGTEIAYLNSGDWVCSRSALEFHDGQGWRVQRLDARGRPLACDSSSSPAALPPEDAAGVGSLAGASGTVP